MARKKTGTYLSPGEAVGGTIFFFIYLLALPFVTGPLFDLVGLLLDVRIGQQLQNTIYYYVLFAVTIIIFHGMLGRTSQKLADNVGTACKVLAAGLIALYGLNELVYRLTRAVAGNQTNLNDVSITAQIDAAPRTTMLIVILLAPFVEEVLFRGLVFGGLREKSRPLAYAASCLLFAFLHVWQFALGNHDVTYFWLMVQYLVPGLVLAWVYDHSGTLWASVGLHAAANALSVWPLL